MSAQLEQTERAPAAAAAAPAAPKQYFKGVVKQVMDGGAVVIRGPPRNGPPAERILALTNIDAPRLARRPTPSNPATEDEPFAWEAREFLRKMVVGKAVLGNFVDEVLLLGEDPETAVNVALKLVEEGLAKVGGYCQDSSLQGAQEQAKNAKKGVWGEGLADHVRKITWEVDNARALVDKFGGKPVSAVVEHVRHGTALRLFLLPDMVRVTLMMSGVRAPSAFRMWMEARNFTESRLLQREIEVILESHENNDFVGSVICPAGNIAEALLKEGMAECDDWSIAKLTGGPEKYRAAEKAAMERKAGIWKDYTPITATFSSIPNNTESHSEEHTGKVQELQELLKESRDKYGKLEAELVEVKNKTKETISTLKKELEDANKLLKTFREKGLCEDSIDSLSPSAAQAKATEEINIETEEVVKSNKRKKFET